MEQNLSGESFLWEKFVWEEIRPDELAKKSFVGKVCEWKFARKILLQFTNSHKVFVGEFESLDGTKTLARLKWDAEKFESVKVWKVTDFIFDESVWIILSAKVKIETSRDAQTPVDYFTAHEDNLCACSLQSLQFSCWQHPNIQIFILPDEFHFSVVMKSKLHPEKYFRHCKL